MKRLWCVAPVVLAFAAGGPAHACRIRAPTVLDDVRHADVVLVGRISNYRIVRDNEFRRRMLSSPHLPADMRAMYESQTTTLLPDYARFDIQVDEVLAGRAPTRLSVTWDNSTFGEPAEMAAGPFLIALRRSNSGTPPLRGPSATIRPSPEPESLTLLQAPCAGAFIFESMSNEARTIRRTLAARPR